MPNYTLNPDQEVVEKVIKARTAKCEKYGKNYCPCVPIKRHCEDTVCPCKDYRENGICICGLYIA